MEDAKIWRSQLHPSHTNSRGLKKRMRMRTRTIRVNDGWIKNRSESRTSLTPLYHRGGS